MNLTQRATTWRAANLRGEEYKRFAGWIRPRTNTEQQGWAATLSTGIVFIISCNQCSSVRKCLIIFLKFSLRIVIFLTKNTNSNVMIGFWFAWFRSAAQFEWWKDILWCLTVFLDTGGSQLRRSLSSCSCLTWKCSSRRRSWRREWQLWGRKV